MASNTLENIKPIITKHSAEFQKDVYASHPTGELVVFALAVLQSEAAPVAVEEIVSTCFRLFPNSFALRNYFYWPDSALVARHLQNAKERGLLKGSPTDGYELKGKGKQSARQTAKALNVSLPVPPKVEIPAPEEKKEELPAPVKVEEKSSTPEEKKTPEKTVKKPVAKKQAKKPAVKKEAVKGKPSKKGSTKNITLAPKKAAPKPQAEKKVEKKKTAKPPVKAKQTKPAPKKPAAPPVKGKPKAKPAEKVKGRSATKAKPEVKKETKSTPKGKAQKTKSASPQQLTMAWTTPTAAKKAEVPAAQPKVKKEAPPIAGTQPVKGEVLVPVAVSKEEKVKAAKVIKQVERSDAYQLYRRNGRRAQIGEFDFRNMLFATMESSAETLKRNLDLFKRYASIHFRTDLIAFLEFCEENFSTLLVVKAKGKK